MPPFFGVWSEIKLGPFLKDACFTDEGVEARELIQGEMSALMERLKPDADIDSSDGVFVEVDTAGIVDGAMMRIVDKSEHSEDEHI